MVNGVDWGSKGDKLARRLQRGFTLIELMVVMAIISILLTIALPIYQKSITRAKESVLRNNLFTLRTMIDEYTIDKQKAPESLQDLVSEGYLRRVASRSPGTENATALFLSTRRRGWKVGLGRSGPPADVVILVTSPSPADLFTSRDTVSMLEREGARKKASILF